MKPAWLTPSMLRNFQQLQGMAVAVVVLALIPWLAQDFAASLAATQMTTHTTLRTVSEKNVVGFVLLVVAIYAAIR